jgi:hypothetical protein
MTEIKEIFKAFSEDVVLKKLAFESCYATMKNCLQEDMECLGGFKFEELKVEFVKQQIVLEHILYDAPYVKTSLGIFLKEEREDFIGNLEPIGTYELDTSLEGEIIEDWLMIDVEKNNQLDIVGDLKDLNHLLPEKYLKRNSIYYEYLTYIAHVISLYQARNLYACQLFIIRAFQFAQSKTIQVDFQNYLDESQKYLRKIVSYLGECNLLDESLMQKFEELGILNSKRK